MVSINRMETPSRPPTATEYSEDGIRTPDTSTVTSGSGDVSQVGGCSPENTDSEDPLEGFPDSCSFLSTTGANTPTASVYEMPSAFEVSEAIVSDRAMRPHRFTVRMEGLIGRVPDGLSIT